MVLGEEESVQVSLFQGLKSTQTWYLGRKNVSSLERCPYFKDTDVVLGEEESVLFREVSLFQGCPYIHTTCQAPTPDMKLMVS